MSPFGFRILARFAFAAIAGLATLAAGQSAQAVPTTFANFTDNSNDFVFTTGMNNTSATLQATGMVQFSFNGLVAPGLPSGPQTAILSFSVTTTQQAVSIGGTDIQNFDQSGSFKFVDLSGPYSGSTLLAGTFSSASASGMDGSGTLGLASSTTGSGAATIVFSSDFLSFANTTSRKFSFALNNLINLSDGSSGPSLGSFFLQQFTASATGNFVSDPAPLITVGTPEPASFAMLGLGLAGVGAFTVIRRRGRKSD